MLSGPTLQVVEDIDDYLRHLRFRRSRAESTTKTYAGHLKRFHIWCGERDMSRDAAAFELAGYVMRKDGVLFEEHPVLDLQHGLFAGRGCRSGPRPIAVEPVDCD